MPHRHAPHRAIGHSDEMLDYIDRNDLTPRQFKDIYERDHRTRLSRLQRRAIGLKVPATRSRTRALAILRRRPDVDEVAVVRGKGKHRKVLVFYTRKRNGQVQKHGPDGRFLHFTKAERRKLHPRVKKSRPSQAKKGHP